jgi:hypothetical protein
VAKKVKADEAANFSAMAQHKDVPSSQLVPRPSSSMTMRLASPKLFKMLAISFISMAKVEALHSIESDMPTLEKILSANLNQTLERSFKK